MRFVRLKRPVVIIIAISITVLVLLGLCVAYFVGLDRLQDRARLKAELTGKVLGQLPDFTIKESIKAAFETSQRTVPVIRADITESAVMTSRTFHYERQEVRARLASDVAQVLVAPGDMVKAGQPLCLLYNESAEALLTQARLDFELQQAKLQDLLDPTSATTTPQDLETLRLKVRQAEIALELKQIELAKLSIAAPSAGKIVSVKVNSNDSVTSAQSVATIFDDTRMVVLANVSQGDIRHVHIGMEASVAFGTELPSTTGKITRIGLEGSVSGNNVVVPVSIEIDNPNGTYKAGMAANVSMYVDDETTVSASATCTPGTRIEVKSLVAGTVSDILVKDGDRVASGQPLLKLANRTVELGVEQAQNDLDIARAALSEVESSQPVKTSDLLAQQLKVEQARWTLQQRQMDVDSLNVVAPFDGTVTRVTVRPGDRLAAGASVLTVQNPTKMVVSVSIPEALAAKVHLGQQADIVFDQLTDIPYIGTVVSMDTEAQAGEKGATFGAAVEIAKPVSLKPGMTAKVTINTEIRENVLAIPVSLVTNVDDEKVVTVLREDKDDFWKRLVQETVVIDTGISDGVLVEVTCGLDEGEELVVPETK